MSQTPVMQNTQLLEIGDCCSGRFAEGTTHTELSGKQKSQLEF